MHKIFTQHRIICLGMLLCLYSVFPRTGMTATIMDFKVPENFKFTKDLRFGSTTRPDISYLQNILNMSTSTRVATTGPGSLKTPSNYYGIKTQDAVGRFQSIFAKDIEFEKSISTSTATSTTNISSSTVDVFTRAVLNKLIIIYSGDKQRYMEHLKTGVTPKTTEEIVPSEVGAGSTGGSSGYTGSTEGSSGNTSGIQQPHVYIYQGKKFLFKYSPEGQLLNAIGGQELVDSVFSYTPAGQVGQMSGAEVAGAGAGTATGFGLAGAGGAAAGGAAVAPLNFGGITTAMVNCTCSANILLYVQDVRGTNLPLIYQPGATILYMNYRPTSGVWVLGNYIAGGQCLIYAGTGCTTGGTPVGTMTQVGTSLTIGK